MNLNAVTSQIKKASGHTQHIGLRIWLGVLGQDFIQQSVKAIQYSYWWVKATKKLLLKLSVKMWFKSKMLLFSVLYQTTQFWSCLVQKNPTFELFNPKRPIFVGSLCAKQRRKLGQINPRIGPVWVAFDKFDEIVTFSFIFLCRNQSTFWQINSWKYFTSACSQSTKCEFHFWNLFSSYLGSFRCTLVLYVQ